MSLSANLRSNLLKILRVKSITLDGVRISTDPIDPVTRQLRSHLFKKTYEAPERAMILALITQDDRVLDIGACIGLTSVLCASRVGSHNVVAYEANPGLETVIRKNFRLNELQPDLRMRAVTADGRSVELKMGKNVFSSSFFQRADTNSVTVPSERIEDIITSFKPTMVLMDVEGAEAELIDACSFEGVEKLVLETHPHIIGADRVQALMVRLISLGFAEHSREGISIAFVRKGG